MTLEMVEMMLEMLGDDTGDGGDDTGQQVSWLLCLVWEERR